MARPLALVALGGIAIAVVCLPLAASLHPTSYSWLDHLNWDDDDGPSGSSAVITRDFPWQGDEMELDVPGDLHFTPGPQWHLTITGPQAVLDRLRVEDGSIELKHMHRGGHSLKFELTGPALRRVELNGAGNLRLEHLRQDSLTVEIHGAGDVNGDGSTDSLELNILGAGSAHLEQLRVHDAKISIAGSGDADVTPTDQADVEIAGTGDVRLHAQPKHLTQQISGLGRVKVVSDAPSGTQPSTDQGSDHGTDQST